MASSPRRDLRSSSYPVTANETVRLLLRLQKAAQKINSILDLDELLEEVVDQVCELFGCLETCVLLKDEFSSDLVVRATRGCRIHNKGEHFPPGKGLVSHVAQIGRTLYTPDVSLDSRYVRCAASTQSEIDIPLKVRDRVFGVFSVAHPDLDGFSRPERQVLEAMAAHIAVAIDNATRFQRERMEGERMRIEQEEARKIQEAMLPKQNPTVKGYSISGASKPAGAVGGDFFDYIPMSNGRLGLVLADVSGKGLAAALLMSTTRGILRALARQTGSAGEIVAQLNRILIEDFPAEKFVTMVFAVLDPAAGTLQIVNAGHLPPLLVYNGDTQLLSSQCGLPLGIMESAYCDIEVVLKPGSTLVMYSDGITEAENTAKEDFGTDRLVRAASHSSISPSVLLAGVAEFAGGMPQHDDSTVIVLQRAGD